MQTLTCLALSLVLFVVCLMGTSGCSEHPATGQVSGVVTHDGEPLPKADIRFIPDPLGPRGAIAKTDDQGRYRLMYSSEVEGIIPGKYKVVISTRGSAANAPPPPTEGESDSSSNPYANTPNSMTMAAGKEMLPMKYCSSKETILRAEVKEGTNTIDFELEK